MSIVPKNHSTDHSTGHPGDRSTDHSTGHPTDHSTGRLGDRSTDRSANRPADLPAPSGERRKEARQRAIVAAVRERGFASMEELAARLGVTTQTIRRDVADLEAGGHVHRYHGGAGLPTSVDAAYYQRRKVANVEGKRRIAARIAGLVPDGASLFLDAGTTMEAVAEALGGRRGLRAVTYNLRVANLLAERGEISIAVPGGVIRNADSSVFGEGAAAFLKRFRFDIALIGVSGIDEEGMMLDDDYDEVELVRAAIGQARRVILATDASKFDGGGLVCLGPVGEVAALVTDASPPPKLAALLAAASVELYVV